MAEGWEKTAPRTLSLNVSFLFHLSAFCMFLYMFCWHFGSEAGSLPQAGGFGWYFKYLTFCGFTLQLISLLFCVLFHLFPEISVLRLSADDLSSASFVTANVVTCMYWIIFVVTAKPVQNEQGGGMKRGIVVRGLDLNAPFWVTLVMHVGNAIVAWVDVLICERSFRSTSLWIDIVFSLAYIVWLHICGSRNKAYPYPFLNALPQPGGFIGMAAAGVVGVCLFSRVGALLSKRVSLSGRKAKVDKIL